MQADKRFEHFVTAVAKSEQAWGLYEDNEGWALAGTDDSEAPVFPLWPTRRDAIACAADEWQGFEACAVGFEALLDELLPQLETDGIAVSIFPTPDGQGVVMAADALVHAIKAHLAEPDA
ncbi:MAG: DUF2750 domain-containing protein [Acidimicrobiia bacterium]